MTPRRLETAAPKTRANANAQPTPSGHAAPAEVRCRVVLLDTYTKRPSGTFRHVYEAKQRAVVSGPTSAAEMPL